MLKTKRSVSPKKKEAVVKTEKKSLTAGEVVGEKAPPGGLVSPDKRSGRTTDGFRFDGVVDNRRIPDAGVLTHFMEGILEIAPEGHGYLRPKFSPSDKDVYISSSQIRRFNLRAGDMTGGQVREPKENERYYGLLKVEKVNGQPVSKLGKRPFFENLTPIYPNEQIKLETGKAPVSTRVIDLIDPIGKGQRGLIVSPPKAGKTWLLKDIANGIAENHKEAHLMAVLVGERPEEVTDIARSVKGEVIASNFDEPPEQQTSAAEVALERPAVVVAGQVGTAPELAEGVAVTD